jgi:Lysine methyltransferase
MMAQPSRGTLDEASSDEELNPFAALSAEDDLFTDDAASLTVRRPPRPDWGIPSFEDQCNGVNTFTLNRSDEQGLPVAGQSVTVNLEHRRHSTGSDLWEAALVLAHALDRPVPEHGATAPTTTTLFRDAHTVIELGSGTGALGLYIAHVLEARAVALTDLAPNLELLRANRDFNDTASSSSCCVEVIALDWTDNTLSEQLVTWKQREAAHGVDLIVGSDLFLPFAPHLLKPLARTIRDLLHQLGHAGTHAVLAYEERFDCSAFYTYAKGYGLEVERIDDDWLHPCYRDPGRIYVLRIRMAESTS